MDEIEVKFRVSDPGEMRRKLKSLGAKCHGSVFEKNVMFDTRDRRLWREDKLLRLRETNGCLVTYKGPRDHDHEFKKRPEVNFETRDPDAMLEMFGGLGFPPDHRYEKKRETWNLRGTEVLIDEVPLMGFFVEIEGGTEDIKKAIELLGLGNQEHITKMYFELWVEYLKAHDMEIKKDMVF